MKPVGVVKSGPPPWFWERRRRELIRRIERERAALRVKSAVGRKPDVLGGAGVVRQVKPKDQEVKVWICFEWGRIYVLIVFVGIRLSGGRGC